jgi:hypothetical protein
MINHNQFRKLVIQPALNAIDLYCENAEELLIMTCAQETLGCTFLKQISGPALGPYGCEPATYKDVCMRKLYKWVPSNESEALLMLAMTGLGHKVNKALGWNYFDEIPDVSYLTTNLAYATMICRIDYLQEVEPLPDKNDVKALFNYYKKYYNTYGGKATESEVMDNYHLFLRGR